MELAGDHQNTIAMADDQCTISVQCAHVHKYNTRTIYTGLINDIIGIQYTLNQTINAYAHSTRIQ